jgi:hypothetical protein
MKDELVADFRIASPQVTAAAAFAMLIFSGFSAPHCGATVYDSDGSEANVRALVDRAHDGDTITLPAGTFSWSSRLNIKKGITIQGATTIKDAGTDNPTIDDATIIQDDTRRTGSGRGIINVAIRSNQSFRLTGITFSPGSSTTVAVGDGAIHLLSHDSAPCTSMRIDHCHFNSLYQGKIIWVSGWVYGVADHNVFDFSRGTFPFHIWHDTWGGASQRNGNGSWADYPWYGTGKFFFMEDNTVRSNTRKPRSFVDTFYGGRWVARHNYLSNTIPSGHGTEGGTARGQRVSEFYDNTVNMTVPWGAGGQRSGTSLWHDNVFIGVESSHKSHCNLPNFRETPARPHPVWGIADGTSVWDQNDTEGNGTCVEGRPPYLFDSGTDTSSINSQGVIHDSTKSWTPNQWVGYSIKNTNRASASYGLGSYIISNTSNTITYSYYSAADAKTHLIFNAGDTYEIHRVLTMMDQNGRGKGDQVAGQQRPINSKAARPLWTHEALEPCYSWNNIHSPSNHVYGFHVHPAQPTTKLGLDYFNLGADFAWDTTPSEVSARYKAALNGVDYVGPFVYPHPLVSGGGSPTLTPSARRSFSRHLTKKKKTNAKTVKKRNQAWISGSLKSDRE